jgi:hypothetical protein
MDRRHALWLAAIGSVNPLCSQSRPTRVYVYALRESDTGSWQTILMDGAPMAKLKRGTYFAVDVTPGPHVFAVQGGASVVIKAQPGENAYLRLGAHHETGQRAIPMLSAMHQDLAPKEMLYLSYIDASKIVSSSVPRKDPREAAELQLRTREAR